MDVIVKQSVNDLMLRASRTTTGITRGAPAVKPGFVPTDTGFLAASLVSRLNGSTMLGGEASWRFIVAGMQAGDWADFGWTAEYALTVHDRGWLWVSSAAADWQGIVDRATLRARAQVTR